MRIIGVGVNSTLIWIGKLTPTLIITGSSKMNTGSFLSLLPLLLVLLIGGLIWAKVIRDARNMPAMLQVPGGALELKGPGSNLFSVGA